MLIDFVLVGAGIALLAAGGEALVKGALRITRPLGISPLLAGLVIVGFGTSSPELAVSLGAAVAGQSDIAVGNVVGSNIANILLILGLSAAIAPLAVTRLAFRRDAVAMIAATVLVLAVMATGTIPRAVGALFIAAMVGYIVWAYRTERRVAPEQDPAEVVHPPGSLPMAVALVVVGLGVLIGGAQLLIRGAVAIAADLGVSEAVIGLTVVAVGTSLPELTVSLVATFRGKADIAVGNILGSNIFNALGILGVSALASPLAVHARVLLFDQWVMLGSALVLTFFLYTGMRLVRWEGAALLIGYAGYIVLTYTHFAG